MSSLRHLGTLTDYKGSERAWHAWSDGELEATETLVAENFAPDGPSLLERDDNGTRWHRLVKLHEPGTFARLSAPRQTGQPKQPRAGRPVDALAGLSLFRLRERGLGAGYVHLRGQAAVALLERRGVVRVGESFAYLPPGGRPDHRVSEALVKALPLLRGDPCAWCGAEATTVAEAAPAPLAWCGEHPCQAQQKRAA